MSGGHFDYKQYQIGYIADEVEQLIETNDIIRMARSVAHPETEDPVNDGFITLTIDEMERFVALVAATVTGTQVHTRPSQSGKTQSTTNAAQP